MGALLQWPTPELCPLCRLPSLGGEAGITWNWDEVYRFLLRYYQGSSPHAAHVHIGASESRPDTFASRCTSLALPVCIAGPARNRM